MQQWHKYSLLNYINIHLQTYLLFHNNVIPVAILEWKNWGVTLRDQGKSRGANKCQSCVVIFRCFEDYVVMINPIKLNMSLWISLNTN